MEHYITISGANIWTIIHDELADSQKPFLLMCGGGPGVNDGLNEMDPLLNEYFNTIRFNTRGCGTSTADKNYSIETVINDIEEIRKYFNVEKWYILGHSWGANIALFYALEHPEHCERIVYLCGLGVQNDMDWSEECARHAAEQTEPERPPRQDVDDTMNYEVLDVQIHSFHKYIQKPMLLRQIATLPIPVCVMCGRLDIRPMWPAIQLANLLPYGKLLIFEECGHFPWVTHPEQVKSSVLDWFHDGK